MTSRKLGVSAALVEGELVMTPLPAAVPPQLLAQRVAEARRIDVDRPGGLTKVTRTT